MTNLVDKAIRKLLDRAVTGQNYIQIADILIQWGTDTIMPSQAETSTTKTISFAKKYTSVPVVVTGLGGLPAIDRLILSTASVGVDDWTVHINASNTTNRRFYWISIGIASGGGTA